MNCFNHTAVFLDASDVIRSALTTTKLFVTGMFRTARAMVSAVTSGSVNGVGVGRPASEESDFANLIIERRIPSARKSLFDETDILITNIVAGTQLEQIGAGLKPLNSAEPKEVAEFKDSLSKFTHRNGELIKAGIMEAGYLSVINKPMPSITVLN